MLSTLIRRFLSQQRRSTSLVNMQRKLDITQPALANLLTKEVVHLCSIFLNQSYEIRLVGGCVRDMLLERECKDIDLSTTARPDQMISLFKEHQIRYIETGLQHGTLTVHYGDRDYEITTLRIDVETFGRAARVEFTNDWRLDAERRDLTFNAMSLDVDGALYDYFGGEGDLAQGKVRFVGNPDSRIREDYLRILRYFRFFGKIAPSVENHEQDTLDSIKKLSPGLKNIAVERVWMEFSKILVGNHAPHLVRLMYQLGVATHMGLPEHSESILAEFESVWKRTRPRITETKPVVLMAAFVTNGNQANELCLQWKLSNFDKTLCCFITSHRSIGNNEDSGDKSLKPYQDLIVGKGGPHIVELVKQLLLYQGKIKESELIEQWDIPKFPITGSDLKKSSVKPGPSFGKLMNTLKEHWIESGYTLTKDLLLEEIERLKT